MQISSQLLQFPLALAKPDLQKLLQNLQPGQLLKATISGRTAADTIRLQIGAHELLATTRLPLKAGQTLHMVVMQSGKTVQLRLLREPDHTAVQQQFLRQSLPRQIPQARLLNTLQAMTNLAPAALQPWLRKEGVRATAQNPPAAPSGGVRQPPLPAPSPATAGGTMPALKMLPPDLQQAIEAVLARPLPQNSAISASQIRQALLDSGLFLEANLASGRTAQQCADTKASLFSLLSLLRKHLRPGQPQGTAPQRARPGAAEGRQMLQQLLETLGRQTEGALARIQTHQLNALPAEEGSNPVWQFELPIRQPERIDSFLIRLEQEQKGSQQQTGTGWKIRLHFDFAPLGPVEARLNLCGERISAVFLAEQADSAALLSRHLPRLGDAFARAGLEVGPLHSRQEAVEPPSAHPATAAAFLLDEQA